MQLDALRAHLIRQSGESPDAKIPIPDNYKVMGEWVKEHLAGRLDLLPRAERAASKAEYTEVGMVYRALLILANEHRDSRMGTGADKAFRDALAQYGMDFSGSIDKSRAGQEGDAYYVNYPTSGPINGRSCSSTSSGETPAKTATACGSTTSGTRTPIRSWSAGSRPTSATGSAENTDLFFHVASSLSVETCKEYSSPHSFRIQKFRPSYFRKKRISSFFDVFLEKMTKIS